MDINQSAPKQIKINIDYDSTSLLYRRLREYSTSEPYQSEHKGDEWKIVDITYHKQRIEFKDFSLNGRIRDIISNKHCFHYGDLFLLHGNSSEIIVRDEFGNGYYSNRHMSLNEHINRYISIEEDVDKLLSSFAHLTKSRIYSLCKFMIIDRIRLDKETTLRLENENIYYKNLLLLSEEETARNMTVNCIITNRLIINVEDLNIALAILGKIDRREYDMVPPEPTVAELYEGLEISRIKRATVLPNHV